MIKRFVGLKPGKPRDRSAPIRKRSKNPKAVTKLGLTKKLAKWCRDYGECIKCGSYDPGRQAHHVYTRGSTPCLKLCADNLIPLCPTCHAFAHANPAAMDVWIEHLKPGLLSHLSRLSRSQKWQKRDLSELATEIDSLPCFRDWFARGLA